MMKMIRLTAAQALVRYLAAQFIEIDGEKLPLFAGVWAIFGHGNVAGIGEALHAAGDTLPTFRAHNEQAMAHSATAYAKAMRRQRMMAVTTSIGPGATNLVTAAAVAHVNRLPLLLIPGDVFANRAPDPVLQQVEDFGDGTISANDCLRPVSRYFDRISRPEHLLTALPRAMNVLTDPANCGPVTLAFCQDTQSEAYDYPEPFFAPRLHRIMRMPPEAESLAQAAALLAKAKKPIIVIGGGVLYSQAEAQLADFAQRRGIPAMETQAGKSALPTDHSMNMGAVGVTGTGAANTMAEAADLVLAVGTRLADFTTGSWAVFKNPDRNIIALNVQAYDSIKHGALPLIADAKAGLAALDAALGTYQAPQTWTSSAKAQKQAWLECAASYTNAGNQALPSDAQVLGALMRKSRPSDIVVSAAGGLPGEMHKLWQAGAPMGYHMEYGYSTMGYEIAGGLGVKMANPHRDVFVLIGDGSYLMMNSEIATSVMMDRKLIILLNDNGGFGCINRLQAATGGAPFNNLLVDSRHEVLPAVDFVAHARSLGAIAVKVDTLAELEAAIDEARKAPRTSVIVMDTDAAKSTDAGGFWWDVAVPEVSTRDAVKAARKDYEAKLAERAALPST
ncbi:MAG: 3D-(3,5/4)-trihydroxycyclohexane-1,2-dione acylhydrolase (decyclizing) [Hyphomicrobiales bacterium]|nr:3D-(3,5/4)-trihydroxycyclohexane-1,2-dione acylhydrolase (decyclizing) [Hyphomicrobiales bacterium]MDE2115103.1 3D-(3,5/4)-trihydroxycyclohexane-1,2-dione acylhydrolase (decyclizing) [Hyphomicrobiales bacterium]